MTAMEQKHVGVKSIALGRYYFLDWNEHLYSILELLSTNKLTGAGSDCLKDVTCHLLSPQFA